MTLDCNDLAALLFGGQRFCCTSCHEDEDFDSFSYPLAVTTCPFDESTSIKYCCTMNKHVAALTDDQWRAMIAGRAGRFDYLLDLPVIPLPS